MAMDHLSAPVDNLLDDLPVENNGPSPQTNNGDNSNEHKDGGNQFSNGDIHISSQEVDLSDEEIQSSSEPERKREETQPSSPSHVQVSRQTLSEYKASKRRERHVRMTSAMRSPESVEDDDILFLEPRDVHRRSSWQPAPSSDRSISTFASSSSVEPSAPNSATDLSTENIDTVPKKVTKRLPSNCSPSQKSIQSHRDKPNEMDLKVKHNSTVSPNQDQDKNQTPLAEDIHDAYQFLRHQHSPRSNRPANVSLSGDDVKLEFATLISRNHTTGALPPHRGGVATSRSWAAASSDSDDLTLLRDDDDDDGDDESDGDDVASPMSNKSRIGAMSSTLPVSPPEVSTEFDERAIKVEYARVGPATRRPRGGADLPSQSEHGTKSTRQNPQRPASLNPLIDDDDPQAATRRLEAALLRKSMSANYAADALAEGNHRERHPRPSRPTYDRTVPGAHEIAAPAAFQERRVDRREEFERYDSYLTNRDQYLVSATVVKEDEEEERQRLARDRSERFRLLESRQADLEEQIAEQKRLILAHHEELTRLKNTRGDIVQAEVIGQADAELDRQIRQRESIIAAKKAELDSLMFPGIDWWKRHDKKKKGGLMSKFNPFRKNNVGTIGELDDSNHSMQTTSTHSKRQQGGSQHNRVFGSDSSIRELDESGREEQGTTAHSTGELDLSNRQSLLLETKKRSERFIAPEKLPFDDNTISELKQIAEESNVDISGCVERGQIVKKLESAGVKSKKKSTLNKLFGLSKSSKNSLGKSSTHSTTKSPVKESKRTVENLPDTMPSPAFAEKRESCYTHKQADKFEGISISQLKKIARDHNVDVSTCTDRNDLVNVLYAAGMRPPGQGDSSTEKFDEFSISELKTLARANRVDISSCVEKSQIVGALNVAGVRPPKKGTPSYPGGATWDTLSISELKRLARDRNVDVSMCVEKTEIISILRRAGVAPSSHAPRLTRSELSGWRPAQLQMLANHVGGPPTGSAGSKELLNKILHVVNEEKKNLRGPVRTIAPFCSAPLAKLRSFATEKRVNISGCVEKDEILRRIIEACVR